MKTTHYILFTALQALAPCFGWEISVHTNEFTDAVSYDVRMAGAKYKSTFGESTPYLTVRHTPKVIDTKKQLVYNYIEAFITMPSDVIESRTALIRIDANPATNFTGTLSTDYHSLFLPAKFANALDAKPHKIIIQVTTFGSTPRIIKFNTDALQPFVKSELKPMIISTPPPNVKFIK